MKPSEILAEALIRLADLDTDRASQRNGKGYRSIDSDICGKLATWARVRPLSEAQSKLALKRLAFYQNTQLSDLKLPSLEEVEREYRALALVASHRPEVHELVLDGDNQIAVVCVPFDYGVVERCKELGGTFQATNGRKAWRFKRVKLAELHEAFPSYEMDAELTAEMEMKWSIQKQESTEKTLEKNRLLNQVEGETFGSYTLREHQRSGIDWAIERGRGILAFEPGTGKTVIGTVWAKAHAALSRAVFVVSPKSVVSVWGETARDIGVPLSIYTRHYLKIPKPLDSSEYVVVVDEAHYFKNPKAKSTQMLLELVGHVNCKGVLLLTGTPMMNGRPVELEPLLAMVDWPELSPFDSKAKAAYERKYCNAHQEMIGSQRIWVTSDIPPEPILRELRSKIMAVDGKGGWLYSKKADECLDLPPLTRSRVRVELESKEKSSYDRQIREAKEAYQKSAARKEEDRLSDLSKAIEFAVEVGDARTAKILEAAKKEKPQDAALLVAQGQLRSIGEMAKIPTAVEIIQDLLDAGEQVVVFSNFVETAKQIAEQCGGSTIDGSVSGPTRDERITAFQEGRLRVISCTYGAGSEGITLTASRHIILMGLPWTPGRLEQAEKRIHRISQERPSFVTTLTLDKIDDLVYDTLVTKSTAIETLLEDDLRREALRITREMMG